MREKLVCEFRYVILNPGNGRAAFKIDKRPGGRVKDLRLDAINQSYKTGRLDKTAARKAVEDLRYTLYKENKAIRAVVGNTDNQRLVEQYWEAEYAHRTLQDRSTARYELDRMVEAVGLLSIHSASRQELQAAVDKKKGNKQRRLVAALKRLLVFAGRHDVKLRQEKPEKRRVKFLTEKEFKFVLEFIPFDIYSILMQVAFYTGARIGECFAMEPEDFNERSLELRIMGQVDRDEKSRDTKNGRDRTTIVFPPGKRPLKSWFKLKSKFKLRDRLNMAETVKDACKKAFPKDARKHLTFHDLRHCFARLCCENGATTDYIADLIGDSPLVTKVHYIGFGVPNSAMDSLRKSLVKKYKTTAD